VLIKTQSKSKMAVARRFEIFGLVAKPPKIAEMQKKLPNELDLFDIILFAKAVTK
jgi:hypothetical protein